MLILGGERQRPSRENADDDFLLRADVACEVAQLNRHLRIANRKLRSFGNLVAELLARTAAEEGEVALSIAGAGDGGVLLDGEAALHIDDGVGNGLTGIEQRRIGAGHAAKRRGWRTRVAHGSAAVADVATDEDLHIAAVAGHREGIRTGIDVRRAAAPLDYQEEGASASDEDLAAVIIDERRRRRRLLTDELAAEAAAVL